MSLLLFFCEDLHGRYVLEKMEERNDMSRNTGASYRELNCSSIGPNPKERWTLAIRMPAIRLGESPGNFVMPVLAL